jgi:hypothetical protein
LLSEAQPKNALVTPPPKFGNDCKQQWCGGQAGARTQLQIQPEIKQLYTSAYTRLCLNISLRQGFDCILKNQFSAVLLFYNFTTVKFKQALLLAQPQSKCLLLFLVKIRCVKASAEFSWLCYIF